MMTKEERAVARLGYLDVERDALLVDALGDGGDTALHYVVRGAAAAPAPASGRAVPPHSALRRC